MFLYGNMDMSSSPSRFFDPKERAAEKQRSRDEDARALASGEASVADLRRKNGAFRVGQVNLLGAKRYG
jgi:hypothetical protein